MVGHDTVVVQDNLTNAQPGEEVGTLEREEDQLKKEEKEEDALDVIGRQSVQTGAVGQPNGQAKKATEADKDQALLAQSVTNQQVAGTGNSQVRNEIKQTLESTGKFGKEPDDVNYTAMKEGLKKLDEQLNEQVKKENMLVSWRDLRKTYIWIASAAHQYVNTHKTAFTSSGKSRKRHARALLHLCKSDVMRLNMAIQRPDMIDSQSTWKQLLDKKPENANDSKLSVKNLADNKYTGRSMNDIVVTAGFGVMTKEQFMVMSGLSMDQIPEKYRDILPLLDTYLEKLTLGPAGKMQLNDDSQMALGQIWSLADMYIDDKKKNQAAMAEGQEFAEARLTRTMTMLKRQCEEVLNPKKNAPVTSPADRLHGDLPKPGKVNEEKELEELTKDTSKKEVPKKVTPQPEAPKKETPQQGAEVEKLERKEDQLKKEEKEVATTDPVKQQVVQTGGSDQTAGMGRKTIVPVAKQNIQAQNMVLQRPNGLNGSLFSKAGFEAASGWTFEEIPKSYRNLGNLLNAYTNMINSGQGRDEQGRDAIIAKLTQIQNLTKAYIQSSGAGAEKAAGRRRNRGKAQNNEKIRQLRACMNTLNKDCESKIETMRAGGDVNPVIPYPFGKLPPAGVKPVAQPQQTPVASKPVAQTQQTPVASKSVAQTQQTPVAPEPVAQTQQQTPVAPEPVVQKDQQSQAQTNTEETQQQQETNTEVPKNQGESQDQAEQQNQTAQQNEGQQQPPQQQQQTTGPTGPSMRKTLLDELKESERLGGRVINPAYKHLITQYEALYKVLGDTITEAKQKESWEKLKKAYMEVAELSDQYARTHADAPTAVGRVCRRYARMLLFMCRFDMRTLRIANNDEELAKKNMTWIQILEQPAAPTTQQTQTQQTETQQTEAQQTETQDAVQTNQPKGNPARDFRNLEQQLSNSEKGGLGRKNSKYFNRVMVALEQTAKAMDQGFGHVSSENIETLKAACAALQELLDACKQYTARNPRTKNGKARRSIVLLIQNYAEKDLRGCGSKLFEFYSMPADEQAKETWQSVIGGVRAMQLTVEDYSKLGSAEGGAASDTIKIELQEGDRAVTKYFKKEDSFNLEIIKEKGDDAPHYFAMQDTLQKYPNLSEKDKELLQKLSRDASLENKDFSEEGLLAAEYCKKRTAQVKTTIESLMISLGITEEGGMANMSRRNVATSRIAELLGLENLVAKSRTVDILDQATGQTIRGNLMDQAEGKEYDKVENAITENKIDSGFIRDLTNLQVLDILCGQVDRHRNNMLYKTDDQGTVIGVQGIDNDGAFGTNTDVASAKNPYRKDLRVFDPETLEMIIPFMDDGLATRIEQLDSATIRYVLKDLLTDEEIEATGKRLDLLQKGIKKARDEHSDRFLKEEKDWTVGINNQDPNKKTVEEKMLDSYDDNFANSDPDSDVNKERIKKMAAEKFKDDPKIVSGINLFYDDENKFFEKYSSEEIREIMRERLKLREIIRDEGKVTYRNNRNYFGRIMRKHDH
ncbi:MAG: hypothetical protein ACI4EE_06300 [Lachnospiraceae bacterium]